MGFIYDDEFMLLMDFEPVPGAFNGPAVSPEDLLKLKDAGIRTAIKYLYWFNVEPTKGKRSWKGPDEWVARMRSAGLKTLLGVYVAPVQWAPDEWYTRIAAGTTRGALSLWNQEAQAYSDDFIARCCKRYNSDDVLVYNTHLCSGETIYLNEPAFFDPAALESFHAFAGSRQLPAFDPVPNEATTEAWLQKSYIDHMVRTNGIYIQNQYREIWSSLHRQIANFSGLYGNGCKWITDVYQAYRAAWPDAVINAIQYTYIQWPGVHPLYQQDAAQFGVRYWGGAEYCEGLAQSVPIAIQTNERGLILAPLYPTLNRSTIESWMTDAIRIGMSQFKAARNVT